MFEGRKELMVLEWWGVSHGCLLSDLLDSYEEDKLLILETIRDFCLRQWRPMGKQEQI